LSRDGRFLSARGRSRPIDEASIVNRREECLKALLDGRAAIVATNSIRA
jgi:hypothetical protein